jgi:hypothetical protein
VHASVTGVWILWAVWLRSTVATLRLMLAGMLRSRLAFPLRNAPPEGATNPRASVPSDSLFSEFILRAFEAAYDKPNANDPFPSAGFKANLRAIAEALETACRLAAEGFGVSEFPVGLIPLHWLKDAAELAYYRAEPGKPNPLAEMDREMRAEVNQYPYLSVLWSAWYPVYLETRPEILGWN